jgi:hypothetical protein
LFIISLLIISCAEGIPGCFYLVCASFQMRDPPPVVKELSFLAEMKVRFE